LDGGVREALFKKMNLSEVEETYSSLKASRGWKTLAAASTRKEPIWRKRGKGVKTRKKKKA